MSKGLKPTPDDLKEWVRKGLLKPEDLLSTRTGSSLSQPKSPKESSLSPGISPPPSKLNKTEREYLAMLQRGGWKEIEPHPMRLRIGPPEERCTYQPDFSALNPIDGRFTLFEAKGPYEHEDARVKRMACARLCQRWGWAFIYAKKEKSGTWEEQGMA